MVIQTLRTIYVVREELSWEAGGCLQLLPQQLLRVALRKNCAWDNRKYPKIRATRWTLVPYNI